MDAEETINICEPPLPATDVTSRSLSDLGKFYGGGGKAAQIVQISRCVGPTMHIEIVAICSRSPIRLATNL